MEKIKIGIVSDTHGILRPEVVKELQGVDRILHAGDIVGLDIIEELERIAPVYAVRGNCDHGEWSMKFPKTDLIQLGEASIYLLHNLYEIDIAPGAAGVNIIICGHSHQPAFEEKAGIVYINPGSCGPRRFSLPISMAIMELESRQCKVQFINLERPKDTNTYTTVLE
ncbi:metallophosphoesterase family protein [Desulfuribacillus alkaliarsenatis]|uniref:Phosphoesterase n=1 Tax=Desulfuribacillus alkaliarsenatis TaxID=766136 RepID=A0A1E5G423_9FIRM|nr:metallophosphoesterase family protein [Desulfuribacillus alkaliarsenatis]OEF97837.1 hypothetical protein BHF68_13480 [Desulfuribacillus alkaliarsenatis]